MKTKHTGFNDRATPLKDNSSRKKRASSTKKPRLGSGERFKDKANAIAKSYMKKGMSAKEAEKVGAATTAKIGIAAYGQSKMTKMAQAGKRRRNT